MMRSDCQWNDRNDDPGDVAERGQGLFDPHVLKDRSIIFAFAGETNCRAH